MSSFEIRELTSMEELPQISKLEKAVWNMAPIPVHQTFTAMKHGGILLGAFDDDKMIGFSYSFAGYNGKLPYLCSHMLGILPNYRQSGLGKNMKLKQAELAKQRGYRMITWTFDPLESKNAYLNLHQLHARGVMYKKDLYGDLNDQLNQGLPTDRIQIEWDLEQQPSHASPILDANNLLLRMDETNAPRLTKQFTDTFDSASDLWFVAIPRYIQTIKQEDFSLAREWRNQTQRVMIKLFEAGFQATDFLAEGLEKVSYYVFTK